MPRETQSVSEWFHGQAPGQSLPQLAGGEQLPLYPPRGPSLPRAATPEGTPSKVQGIVTALSVRVNALEAWALDVQEALRSILECLDGLELELAPDSEEEEADDA